MIDFKNVFLLNHSLRYNDCFVANDDEENFKKNLIKMPVDWHYRFKKITYKANKLKYRCEEFENINWSESIVIFGCSNVFGTGLAEDELIDFHIENITGIKTVNMGIMGSSIFHSLTNIVNMLNFEIKPLAVVNVYTGLDRFLYFSSRGIIPLGPWSYSRFPVKSVFYKEWIEDANHSETFSKILQKNCQLLCSNFKYYECTFFRHTSEVLKIDLTRAIDLARDQLHPGPESAKFAAKNIISNLKL